MPWLHQLNGREFLEGSKETMSWNPLQDLMVLQDRMNRLFEDATQRRTRDDERSADLERPDWSPLADVYETDSEFIVATDLPGIDRSALEITIDENRLHVRGTRKLAQPPSGRAERPGGTFLRTFSVPNTVDQDNIRADYQDGVLEVHLPKRKDQKSKRVEIKIS
jgi:HSP20 family protein